VTTSGPPRPTPAGTQRRLRALMSRGWSPETIERATGMPAPQSARALEDRRGISAEAAARVAAAYDRLWDQPPPQVTDHDRMLAAAAAKRARSGRRPPPLAWDDGQLDRDDAAPAPGWKRPNGKQLRAAVLAEDAAFVRQNGGYRHATNEQVAMRLGVSRARLEKALSRAAHAEHDREAT
jgi:transcriptional regulator with XRE-family HTH domain